MQLTPSQSRALRALIYRVREAGPGARLAVGGGAEVELSTAKALNRMGLVDLHTGEPFSRPARAGFGKAANWKTVVAANRWITATPYLLQKMAEAKAR